MEYILTIDVGGSSIKVALFDKEGNIITVETQEYELKTPSNNIVELDPNVYWYVTKNSIRNILSKIKIDKNNIRAISVCSQGETIICLDKSGEEVGNAIFWLDNRAIKEAVEIEKEFGGDEIYEKTGQQEVIAGWSAPKILWLKNNKKENFKRTSKILFVEDYILYKLSGKYYTEFSMIPSSLLGDIINKKWWKEMLEFVGIDEERLSEIKEPGETIGYIKDDVANDLGLPIDIQIITGAMDQAASMVGAGNIKRGIFCETTGTALAITTTTGKKPIKDPKKRIPFYYHAVRDHYYLLPWSQTAGIILKWFKDEFCFQEIQAANVKKSDVYDILTSKALKTDPGSEGLMVLPYFAGAGCPQMNSYARGIIYGLGLNHKRGHFIRAIMESIGYILQDNIEVLGSLGLNIEKIISLGGGSKSGFWNQIKADITEKPIAVLKNAESTSTGVFILASVALGNHKDIGQACASIVKEKKIYIPDKKNFKLYREKFRLYKDLYNSLEDLYKKYQ